MGRIAITILVADKPEIQLGMAAAVDCQLPNLTKHIFLLFINGSLR
jgi:hypothetical protein